MPTAQAVALARDLISINGEAREIELVLHGTIEEVQKAVCLNYPNLLREIRVVTDMLHKETDSKRSEVLGGVLDAAARALANRFTEMELNDLLQFYKTPLGQKWLLQWPEAQREQSLAVQKWADEFGETLMTRMRAEMEKRGPPIS
jgi:uncharacterized protein